MMSLKFLFFKSFLFLLTLLISLSFVTLVERKIISIGQIRNGPDKSGIKGNVQPFIDGLKLFKKELKEFEFNLGDGPSKILGASSVFFLCMLLWYSLPYKFSSSSMNSFSALWFLSILCVTIYPTLFLTSSSNSKYPLMSLSRSISQSISYEMNLTLGFLFFFFCKSSMDFSAIFFFGSFNFFFSLMSVPFLLLFLISFIAELSRTPFDFSESESELVSGVSSELGAAGFMFIFLGEYGSILLIPVILCLFWFNLGFSLICMVYIVMYSRVAYARVRYDYLMILCWESLFPLMGISVMIMAIF